MTRDNLTAWERWELASFDAAKNSPPEPPPPPAPQQQEVETVRLPTAAEIEQIHQQAHEEGFRKGREEGYQAGYAEGQAQPRAAAEQIGKLAASLEQALADLDTAVADELLALAIEIARGVVRQELAARPEILQEVVREALAQLSHQHAAIYLNPEDAALVRSYLGEQMAHAGHRIHEDYKLARGDCLIEAGGTQVDATVATRWRRVLDGLGLADAWQPAAAVSATRTGHGGDEP